MKTHKKNFSLKYEFITSIIAAIISFLFLLFINASFPSDFYIYDSFLGLLLTFCISIFLLFATYKMYRILAKGAYVMLILSSLMVYNTLNNHVYSSEVRHELRDTNTLVTTVFYKGSKLRTWSHDVTVSNIYITKSTLTLQGDSLIEMKNKLSDNIK